MSFCTFLGFVAAFLHGLKIKTKLNQGFVHRLNPPGNKNNLVSSNSETKRLCLPNIDFIPLKAA